jgi:cyclase
VRPRVIPVLLLRQKGLVKTVKFKNSRYIGDPINALRLYNDMEVDELILLDIDASKERRGPAYEDLVEYGSEAFMPMSYGGGVKTVEQISRVLASGFEKVVLNSTTFDGYNFVEEAASKFGSQAVVAAVDVKKNLFGRYRVFNPLTSKTEKVSLSDHLDRLVTAGAGEIFLNSVDRDGTMQGYDEALISLAGQGLDVPLVVCGGAGSITDFPPALEAGADACAAGSLFVFQSKSRGVLINYPGEQGLRGLFG